MRVLYLILLIIAAVLFLAAAFVPAPVTTTGTPPPRRINLVALGLLAWVLVPLIQQIDRLGD